jgi:acetyltransferase
VKALSSESQRHPSKWEQTLVLQDGSLIFVRPIRPDDEQRIKALLQHVNPEDLRMRFFGTIKEFTHEFLFKLTSLDYTRAMAFVAFEEIADDLQGVVRFHSDLDQKSGEFAILLRSDSKGKGLGWTLMKLIIEYAKSEGMKLVHGQVMHENTIMLDMCREFGFTIASDANEPGTHKLVLNLTGS